MQLVEKKLQGVSFLHVPSWTNAGLFHGFIGKDIDVKHGAMAWDSVFSDFGNLQLMHQVHGIDIVDFESSVKIEKEPKTKKELEADGWISTLSKLKKTKAILGIKTADCFPVILFNSKLQKTAVLHCGWRGTYGGLLEVAISGFSEDLENTEVAIGPGAQVCSYEVKDDLVSRVKTDPFFKSNWIEKRKDKFFLNVSESLRTKAKKNGIKDKNICVANDCTIASESYFSFRRQKDRAGRQLSFVAVNTE